jgi:hypothetical protein
MQVNLPGTFNRIENHYKALPKRSVVFGSAAAAGLLVARSNGG